MARKRVALGIGLVTVGLALPAWAADVVISDEARAHFSAGVNLLQDPDGARYEEAYREFKAAYAASPSWKILGNLGLSAMKLERDSEAIDAIKKYLSEGGKRIDAEERAQFQRDLATLESGVAQVMLQTDPPGATIEDERRQAEVRLDDCVDYCNNLRVAVSPKGDAIVAWTTNTYLVRARRYVKGAWEPRAQTLWATPSTNPPEPAVAIGGGKVVVAWAHHQTAPSNYYMIEMSATSLDGAWPTIPWSNYSVGYSAPNYESIGGVSAAVDTAGVALVVFAHNSSSTTTSSPRGIYYARKPVDMDWEYPVKIPSSNTASSPPVLVSDGSGAMAMWISTPTSGTYSLVASRYTSVKQFIAPVPINDSDLTGYIFLGRDYALAASETAFVATWAQAVGNQTNTYATRFDIARGKWDAEPALVSDGIAQSRDNRAIGIDAHGNAIVAFDQDGPRTSMVLAARYVASTGRWRTAEALTTDGNDYGFPRLTVAPNGTASLFYGPTYRDGPLRGPAPRGAFRIFR